MILIFASIQIQTKSIQRCPKHFNVSCFHCSGSVFLIINYGFWFEKEKDNFAFETLWLVAGWSGVSAGQDNVKSSWLKEAYNIGQGLELVKISIIAPFLSPAWMWDFLEKGLRAVYHSNHFHDSPDSVSFCLKQGPIFHVHSGYNESLCNELFVTAPTGEIISCAEVLNKQFAYYSSLVFVLCIARSLQFAKDRLDILPSRRFHRSCIKESDFNFN